MLSDAIRRKIEHETTQYERRQAACIDALKIVQAGYGWVSDEHILELAGLLNMSPHEIDGVATFYNLVFRRPVGRNVILLCDSVSCWIEGYEQLYEHIHRLLGIRFGQTSSDGAFTILPVPCLGSCDQAPALLLNGELCAAMSSEKLEALIARARKGAA